MNKLNDFFEKAHLILVCIVLSCFSSCVIYGMFNILGISGIHEISQLRILTGSLVMGAIMGAMFTSMFYLMRKAQQFYRDCNTLEDKVKSAQTREELGELFQNEFKSLRERAFHQEMYSRLREIHTRMQTMVGFLPNQ